MASSSKNTYKKDNISNRKKKKEKRKKKKSLSKHFAFINFYKDERLQKTIGLFFILFSIYLLIAFSSYLNSWKTDYNIIDGKTFSFIFSSDNSDIHNLLGKLGAFTAHKFLKVWFGISSYFFTYISFIIGLKILFKITLSPILKSIKVSILSVTWLSMTMAYFYNSSELDFMGGLFGKEIVYWLNNVVGSIGTVFFIIFSGFISIVILFNPSFAWVKTLISKLSKKEENEDKIENEDITLVTPPNNIDYENESPEVVDLSEDIEAEATENNTDAVSLEIEKDISKNETTLETLDDLENTEDKELDVKVGEEDEKLTEDELSDKVKEFGEYDPKLDLSEYELPSIDLLYDYSDGKININKEELEENKHKIINTLNDYKISIKSIKATIGPTITLYEIVPSAGVRISKIKNLEDDIALSLAALGIRIIAPMPGLGTVGIEVPNSKPEIVAMKALIASDKFQNSEMELPIALGKTISNESFITDLTRMPHLLMAGATGQGKSVGLNAILVSILYKKHPSQVKFVLIDPKKVELTLFNKIERHFLAKLPNEEDAIITDVTKVVNTLNSLCVEMEARYELLKNASVRNIKEYNQKFIKRKLNPEKGHRYLPYIVLVVDEFADLIITAGKEVEMPVARIAQLARAIGIHLIIATQRPSVNVITGTIKANFPARVSFRVTSKIDSRTILDAGGADQLIGRGDMLFTSGSDIIRLQCGFVDTPEVDKITEFIGSQRAYPSAFLLPEYIDEANEIKEIDDDLDPMYEDAANLIVNAQQGSASLLQRKLSLGYNRAGRIIDQLEATGVVGSHRGSKAREVLIQDIIALERFLSELREQGKLS